MTDDNVFAVSIQPRGGVSTTVYSTDAELRKEAGEYLSCGIGSGSMDCECLCVCRDIVMLCQPRDSLDATAACSTVLPSENAVASFTMGLRRGERIYGPAFIVRKAGGSVVGLDRMEADRIASIIRGQCAMRGSNVEAESNPAWAGDLAYVDEFGAGKGMAYFLYGSENLTQFIGWDRSPREQYSEPPFDTPRIGVTAVGYQLDGLLVANRGKPVVDMGPCDWFVFNGRKAFEDGVSEDDFIRFVSSNGGRVFTEKE